MEFNIAPRLMSFSLETSIITSEIAIVGKQL